MLILMTGRWTRTSLTSVSPYDHRLKFVDDVDSFVWMPSVLPKAFQKVDMNCEATDEGTPPDATADIFVREVFASWATGLHGI